MPNPFPTWIDIHAARARFDAAGATTQTLSENGAGSTGGAVAALAGFYLNPADYRTTSSRLRIRASTITNAVAPAATFTCGLYPIATSAGGAAVVSVTLGTVVAGSTAAIVTPAATSQVHVDSAEFACPPAGFYLLAVVIDVAMTASSAIAVRANLQAKGL